MRIAGVPTRLRGPIAFWALAAVALLVSHDAVFLAQLGPGEGLTRALRSAGHDYWGAASLVLASVGIVAGMVVGTRLVRLRRQARLLRVEHAAGRPSFLTRLFVTWSRLFAVVAIGFALQESAEHLAMHGHAIGLGALVGPEYPLAVPVIGLITFVGAVVATLVVRTEAVLLATIAAGLHAAARRAPRALLRPPLRLPAPRHSLLAHSAAGRAPPPMLASHS